MIKFSNKFSNAYLVKYRTMRFVKKVAKSEIESALEQLENERDILRLTDHTNVVHMFAELQGKLLSLNNI